MILLCIDFSIDDTVVRKKVICNVVDVERK